MKLHNINEAYKQVENLQAHEKKGRSYNWCLANFYSLLIFQLENKYSMHKMYQEKVVCDTFINQSPQKAEIDGHLYNSFKKTFYFDSINNTYTFVDKQKCEVNLLYLLKVVFCYSKKLILNTRMHDNISSQKTSETVVNPNSDFITHRTEDLINHCLFFEDDVYFTVMKPKGKKDDFISSWYIEDQGEDKNKEMALLLYKKYNMLKRGY